VDSLGTVIASTDLSLIGQPSIARATQDEPGGVVHAGGHTYKSLDASGTGLDYTVFVEGEDDEAKTICLLASIAVQEAKIHYEENNDRSTFIKSILSDNVLPGDIYVRSKDLGFVTDTPRAALLVRQTGTPDLNAITVMRELFPDTQKDFVVSVSASDIALVSEIPDAEDASRTRELAEALEKHLRESGLTAFVIGVGAPAKNLRELADRYREAQVAIEVGKVFDTERTIILYENLGIGRLIYQLPTKLCEMFLSEVFKKNPIEALDSETLYTINKFFENNLNVSETSRRLFVHRNTLVYRLEKIKKITGLDLRELDHAIVFKVALMVKKYLNSQSSGAIQL
jgi:carbohydrate diacid regulator